MKRITVAALGIAALTGICWLAACHSFSTQRGNIDSSRVTGLIYYLPKGRIRISGDFKAGGGDDGAPAGKSQKGGSSRVARAGGSSGSDAPEQKNFVITIAADVEADPSARYYLKPVRNYFYDDTIKLSVNAKHLLSTGNATAQDQTAQIISTTASLIAQAAEPRVVVTGEISPETVNDLLLWIQDAINKKNASVDTTIPAAALFKLPAALGEFPSQTKAEGGVYLKFLSSQDVVSLGLILKLLRLYLPDQRINLNEAPAFKDQLSAALNPETTHRPSEYVQPKPFSIVFDPADKSGFSEVERCGFILSVTPEKQPEIKLLHEIWEGQKLDVAYGIVFRSVKPYRVTIRSVPGTALYIHDSRLVLLPDTRKDHTLVLDYSRLAFVKKTTNVAFVDGIPQDFEQSAPSSVLGFLAIPKGLIQAIVPLSSGITGPPSGVQAPGTSGTTAAPAAAPSSTPDT